MREDLENVKVATIGVRCYHHEKKEFKRYARKKDLSLSRFMVKAAHFYVMDLHKKKLLGLTSLLED